MLIAKTRLVFTDTKNLRQEISVDTEITKDHKIPDDVMERFIELEAVVDEKKPKAEESPKEEKPKAEKKPKAEQKK